MTQSIHTRHHESPSAKCGANQAKFLAIVRQQKRNVPPLKE